MHASAFAFRLPPTLLSVTLLCACSLGCGQQSPSTAPSAEAASSPPADHSTPPESTVAVAPGPSAASTAKASPAPADNDAPARSRAGRGQTPAAIVPTSLLAARQAINLAELPAPRGADYDERTPASCMLTTPLSIADAFDFYLSTLGERGWKELTEGHFRQVAEQYAQSMLGKDGYLLSLYVSPGDEQGSSRVMLRGLGNVDTRALPAPPTAKQLYASQPTTIHTVDTTVPQAAEDCRRLLSEQGWLEYGQKGTARAESDEQRMFTFRQGGVELTVMVGLAPAQGNKTSVHYGVSLLNGELPWPADAQEVEFDDQSLYLAFRSQQEIGQLAEFYLEQLAPMAWSNREEFDQITDKSATLYFDDADRNRLMVRIDDRDDGLRRVRVERFTAAELERIAERARQNEQTSREAEQARAERASGARLDPRGLKLPANARGIDYDADSGEINFTTVDKPTRVTEFFRKQLAGDTWKEDRKFSVVTDEAAVFELKAGANSLSFTLVHFPDADGTRVTVSGSALDWTGASKAEVDPADLALDEPLPEAPQFDEPGDAPQAEEELTAEERDGLPIPSINSGYSSEKTPFRQTVTTVSSLGVPRLVDFYRQELAKRGWKEDADAAAVGDEKTSLQFTGPRGPLTVKLVRENDETQVELFTRSVEAAKKAGILPVEGKARLVFANSLDQGVSLTIDGQTVKLAPGEGEKKPDGPKLDLAPGKYELSVTIDGQTTTEELEVDEDQTWGVIVLEEGALPLLMY